MNLKKYRRDDLFLWQPKQKSAAFTYTAATLVDVFGGQTDPLCKLVSLRLVATALLETPALTRRRAFASAIFIAFATYVACSIAFPHRVPVF